MISYTLKCAEGHSFDSWFASAAAYHALETSGHLSCAVCGDANVHKSLMAPRVSHARVGDMAPEPVLSKPQSDIEKAVAELRRKIEAQSDYVGADFATQARAMHQGDVPERSIWGEAGLDQARELVEDGVPLLPLPFGPKRKLS